MTIITLGPEGTFSHELASRLNDDSIVLKPTINGVFAAVAAGEGDGLVPIENSEAGAVGETMDCLMRFSLSITAEMYLPVHHNLASLVPKGQIRVLYTHPQTHEQCSEYLEQLGVPVIHTSSNASSALEAKKTPNAGAVLPLSAAAIYHIPVVDTDIENNKENTTRFVRIATAPGPGCRAGKCSLLIDPDTDRAGLLYELLGVFARKGINLTRIESRPTKRGMGTYVFFLDYAVTDRTDEALLELDQITTVKRLGCYPKIEVPP